MERDDRRAEGANGDVLRINRATVTQLVIWLTAALLTYAAINARVAVLESELSLFRSDMSEMRNDIKTLLRQTRDAPGRDPR